MVFWLSVLLLTAAVVFGGGSRAGFFGDVYVELLAVPLLLTSLWSWLERGSQIGLRRDSPDFPLQLAAIALLALPLMQLVPLPGLFAGGWWTLSLAPAASWAAVASALPPLALFAAVSQMEARDRFRLAGLAIGLGGVALLLGFLQVAQGPQSALRFFEITNPTEAVGFFANRNHFAAQLYATLIFAAIWFAFMAKDWSRVGAFDTHAVLWLCAALVLLIAIVTGLALARSRAGLLLALGAMAGIVAMVFIDGRASTGRGGSRTMRRAAMVSLGIAVLFAAQFGLHRSLSRFESDPLEDLRIQLTSTTFKAALDNLPFGTGFGSFIPVYAGMERTEDLVGSYANRAHNDWAEFLLETGVPGAIVAALFLWWFTLRTMSIWRRRPPEDEGEGEGTGTDHHLMLQRGASLVVALLLAHSLVDYPLRTTAMVTLFAFSCALLIDAPESETPVQAAPKPPARKRRRKSEAPAAAVKETWGAEIEWPDAWRNRGL